MKKALGHIKVLDLTRVLAGPWATQNLADMGAEVIKVERPHVGDDFRAWGPPFLKGADGQETSDSAYFLSANRGKKSITLNLAATEGQDIIRKLVSDSDVLVENYKVGTLARYGLGYEDLCKLNPRLVYCSITGFGQSGPYSAMPGYDVIFQGMSGVMAITGLPDGEPGGGPLRSGLPISDLVTGMYATSAILGALEHRHVSGKGQHIDLALLDCLVSISGCQVMNYFISGNLPQRMGNSQAVMVPYQVFRCKEGDVIIAVGNDSQYASFCEVIGRPDLAADPRFTSSAQRCRNREMLIPQISAAMLMRPMMEWVERMEAANVPCGPIYNTQQVFDDPQVRHREMRLSLPHSTGVQVPSVANPIRYSDSPISYEHSAPTLGEHTDAVLNGKLGISAEHIAELRGKNIV